MGIGDILSQCTAMNQKPLSYVFFSPCLTLAERNYDIGNKELLPVKLALEE